MRIWFLCLCCLVMAACSPSQAPDQPSEPKIPTVPKIADESRAALDSAKDVNATVEQATEETRKEIDAQTQ